MNKKKTQLGMNPSTASHRLVKDILWKLIQETNNHMCYKCHKEMCRETFSIEHKVPWLDSDNPVEMYFDLENISFSHLKCNISDRRVPNKLSPEEKEKSLERHKEYKRHYMKERYSTKSRRIKYQTTGH